MSSSSSPPDMMMKTGEAVASPRNRADHLLALVRDAAVMTWTLDGQGVLQDGGEWVAFTGQTREETAADGWLAVIHPDDRERTRVAWASARAQEWHFNIDSRIRYEDGVYRWFNIRATPMRAPDGMIERWVGVCLEIPGTWRFDEEPVALTSPDIAAMTIDAPIVRAARAMLDWSAADLSDRSGVSVSTIRRLENDLSEIQSRRTSTFRLLIVFHRAGLRFVDQDGVVTGVCWAKAA